MVSYLAVLKLYPFYVYALMKHTSARIGKAASSSRIAHMHTNGLVDALT
jgi:hypothetical protein